MSRNGEEKKGLENRVTDTTKLLYASPSHPSLRVVWKDKEPKEREKRMDERKSMWERQEWIHDKTYRFPVVLELHPDSYHGNHGGGDRKEAGSPHCCGGEFCA